MPTQEEERKKLRLIDAHKSGEISIRLYTKEGRDYWNLVRETRNGPVEFAAGRGAELREMQTLLKRAEGFFPSPEKEKPERSWFDMLRAPLATLIEKGRSLWNRGAKQEQKAAKQPVHYAIVKLTELTAMGGVGGVITSFPDLKQAERYRDLNPHVALYPSPLSTKPEKGQRVEISFAEIEKLTRRGEGKDLAHQVERLQWAADQGKHFTVALWNDKSKPPEVGQMAHVTTGRDHLDRPIDRLASPLGPFDPGPPNQPQWVVLEHASRNGIARIAALPGNEADAKTIARELNHERDVEEQERSEPAWRALEAGSRLRGIAEFERREAKPESPVIEEPGIKVRELVRGNFTAKIIERRGEDGDTERTVLIEHRSKDKNGIEHTDGMWFPLDELASNRERVRRLAEQKQERLVESPLKEPIQREEPAPKVDQKGREQTPEPQTPKYKIDYPSLNPDPPANGVKDNRFWIGGVWYGAGPVEGETFAFFTVGKTRVEDRMMIPGRENPKTAEPGENPQYILGRIITKNLVQIVSVSSDPKHVEKEVAAREEQAVRLEAKRERDAEIRKNGGVPNAHLDKQIEKQEQQERQAKANALHRANGHTQSNGISV